MTLLDAPGYDSRKEARSRNLLVGSGILVLVLAITAVGGIFLGHGWFFSNLPIEHKVNVFLTNVEAGDYAKAYGMWMNDPEWQQHPQKYDYTLKRFTEDWTTQSDWGPIKSYHVDISKRTGSGVIIAVTVNGSAKKLFLWYEKSNGTLTYSPLDVSY